MRLTVIGGGDLQNANHLPINERLVELTYKQSPNVLFVPTASHDDESYIESFFNVFGKQLNCEVHVLRTLNRKPNKEEQTALIHSADLIYLGGGNYMRMMEYWKTYEIDKSLQHALQKETLIAGISAGAMCWFTSSIRSNEEQNDYAEALGWGTINKRFCPHYHQPDRAIAFHSLLQSYEGNIEGIALEDDCAIYITENSFEIIGKPEKAWEFYMSNGELSRQHLDVTLKSYL
ncbi:MULTISPECIES: peptidase E [unclassified Bacillus cereus group]|uniref:peptidase E n=1 Tax=unclassified Bacillus cereus group TaxID=2750818 RepID=UPI001F56479F|nr:MULTISPECIES: peptidase E [unclassified Bacillus cereus group]